MTTTALTLPERAAEDARIEADWAAQVAEADRLRAIQYAEFKRIAEARDHTNALRGELDALLDEMSDDDLRQVLIFARGMAQRETA
jgi:hypothetical protein